MTINRQKSTELPGEYAEEKSSYRILLGEKAWAQLHPSIQKRFGVEYVKKITLYEGIMKTVKLSFAGKVLAHCCRIIGTPLALYEADNVPIKVEVYPDHKLNGTVWDRYYCYINKPTNRVKSTKCIKKKERLLEMVGCGFGMELRVSESDGSILFESTSFFWQLGRRKIRIPDLLTPGKTLVRQTAMDEERFEFMLSVEHSLLGEVYYQVGVFGEVQ